MQVTPNGILEGLIHSAQIFNILRQILSQIIIFRIFWILNSPKLWACNDKKCQYLFTINTFQTRITIDLENLQESLVIYFWGVRNIGKGA